MHTSWVSMGMDPARFWLITMREIDRELTGAAKRREREFDMLMSTAWHAAAFQRVDKLPKLSDILSRRPTEKQKQSPEEMFLAMKGIFLAHGGSADDLRADNDQHG